MAFISVKQFASSYGLPLDKAYQMSRAKGFPAIRLGRKIQIDEPNVRPWIEKQYGKTIK
jgi:excisionase family DNA binding protein